MNKPDKRKLEQENGVKEKSESSNDKIVSFMAVESFDDSKIWLVDSGASRHMSCDKSGFIKYDELEIPVSVFLGNGSAIEGLGEGSVLIKENKVLKQVLYVPQLRRNLLSISRSLLRGHMIFFDPVTRSANFFYNGKVEMTASLRRNETFVIDTEDEDTCFAATIETWHARFGHAGKGALEKLVQEKAVHGLHFAEEDDNKCVDCSCAKNKRSKHQIRSTPGSWRAGLVLHLDTAGPEIESIGKIDT